MSADAPTVVEAPRLKTAQPDDPRLVHMVLQNEWPIALCGATVMDRFGASAPGMDRCIVCPRIARERGLGRPGWTS